MALAWAQCCSCVAVRDDNGSHFLTRDPSVNWPVTAWPATHDYSRVMTPDYCSFQSGSLSGSALKIKHHHCHKILCRNYCKLIKLTLWLKLCRKSLQCLKNTKSWVNGSRDPLRFVDPLDPWPIVISGRCSRIDTFPKAYHGTKYWHDP